MGDPVFGEGLHRLNQMVKARVGELGYKPKHEKKNWGESHER
jgi:hypothetical protein